MSSSMGHSDFSHRFSASYLSLFREAGANITPGLRARLRGDKNFEALSSPSSKMIPRSEAGGLSEAERLGFACSAILGGQKDALELQISEAELLGAGKPIERGVLRFLVSGEPMSEGSVDEVLARCARAEFDIVNREAIRYGEIAEFLELIAAIFALARGGAEGAEPGLARLAEVVLPKLSRATLEATIGLAAEIMRLQDGFWFAAEKALVSQTAHSSELIGSSAEIFLAHRYNIRAKFAAKLVEFAAPRGDFSALLAGAEAGLPRNFLEPLEHSTAKLPSPTSVILPYILLKKHKIRLENLSAEPSSMASLAPTEAKTIASPIFYDALLTSAREDDEVVSKALTPLCSDILPSDFTSLALVVRALQKGQTGSLEGFFCDLLVQSANDLALPRQKLWLKDQLAEVSYDHAKAITL